MHEPRNQTGPIWPNPEMPELDTPEMLGKNSDFRGRLPAFLKAQKTFVACEKKKVQKRRPALAREIIVESQ